MLDLQQIKRFLKVLLIIELFVIVYTVAPAAVILGFYKWLGWWGLVPSVMILGPWLVAWTDLLKRY